MRQKDKRWILGQWKTDNKLNRIIAENEKQNSGHQSERWFQFGEGMSEDEERFMRIIESHKKEITKYNINAYQSIFTVKQLMDDGGRLYPQRNQCY